MLSVAEHIFLAKHCPLSSHQTPQKQSAVAAHSHAHNNRAQDTRKGRHCAKLAHGAVENGKRNMDNFHTESQADINAHTCAVEQDPSSIRIHTAEETEADLNNSPICMAEENSNAECSNPVILRVLDGSTWF